MNKYKQIGIILAIAILMIVFLSNALLHLFSIDVNLSINRLPYYINFILILLSVALFLLFRLYHKKLIFYVISVFILQNLLINGIDDLIYRFVGFEAHKESSFLIIIPTTILGVIAWGIIFDYLRNKKNKYE